MSVYNYFIEKQLPFVFRYKYSNPNIVRTVLIKEHNEDKGLIVTTEAFTCKIKTFKTDGIHFDTNDLLPSKYVSVYDESVDDNEDIEDKKCNDNKHQFLKYAIENNKTIAFEYSWKDDVHVMTPYRICNFGKSVLMYIDYDDMFRTYDIDEMRFVRIPEELREEEVTETEDDVDDNETEYLESSCDDDDEDDEYNTALALEQSETFRELNRWDDVDETELDISAIDEINDWE
jgi:hypothetical protein